ncbi:MAG: sugar-phosphatase [Clostridiaceae bacterium]|nr:sugar-phosphatase [Clostridiaceae bacterium]
MYKIIALDMDGTLLNDDKVITKKNKEALLQAKERGVKVVLASGRPTEGLKQHLEELGLNEEGQFVLSYNGCLVQEVKNKKIIHETVLSGKDLHYFYDLSCTLGVNIHAFSPTRGLITPKISKYTEVEGNLNKIDINICDFAEVGEDEEIVKIMFIDEADILDKAISQIPKKLFDEYVIVKSTPYFLEIIKKGSGKGVGLKALAEYLGVKREEIIACGDAGNDLDMIEYAGLGVAMENAIEEVKEKAQYITAGNNEDGIAEVVNKFILEN